MSIVMTSEDGSNWYKYPVNRSMVADIVIIPVVLRMSILQTALSCLLTELPE